MIGEAAAVGAAICWAVGSHLFGRIGRGGDVPAGAMNLGKCLTATLLFGLTVLCATGRLWPSAPPSALAWMLASGVVGLALGDTAYFGAIITIGVRRALLLLSTAPVFAAVGGVVFLDERIGVRAALAIGAVLAGVGLVVQERGVASPSAAAPPVRGRGVFFGLCAGLGQAAGSLMSRHAMATGGIGAMDASFVRIAAGLAGILVLATASGRIRAWVRPLATRRRMGSVAGSALIGTYVGIWLAQFAIGHASSTAVATTLLATSPLFALPIGRFLDSEPITARAVAGTALAFAGLATLTLAPG